MAFLYEKLDALEELVGLSPLPAGLAGNLSPRMDLRDYQEEAFRRFVTYYENQRLREGHQPHLLFHMATGSGKTLIMAGLMLYLYGKGYRNFLFFVNSTNVLAKTRENFTNPSSAKYLFAPELEVDGQSVSIRCVDNFQTPAGQDIHLCFTTIQKLHLDLLAPRENGLSLDDFAKGRVALLSDEAHHVNTLTKAGKAEEEALQSWETSVNRAFRASGDNLLLEFTATCDLQDPNVVEKYTDKILFDYPLAKFRASGYTKDFQNLQTGHGPWERALTALVLSQYRLMRFADAHQAVKPVVLLKSQRIAESLDFYNAFFPRLEALTGADLAQLDFPSNPALADCLAYLEERGMTLDMLAQSLKLAFRREQSILMNGQTDNTQEKQLAVNSLEDGDNPYRLIFTVDMLNEGWDVLNLFDIVRLYETRQSSGRTLSPYTIQEAQLIGRGARYCPFRAEPGQARHRRKYDDDLESPLRVCETLFYHSKDNSRYIDELRRALTQLGLLSPTRREIPCRLKSEFRAGPLFSAGLIFSNRQEPLLAPVQAQAPAPLRSLTVSWTAQPGRGVVYDLFSPRQEAAPAGALHRHSLTLAQVPWAIARDALFSFPALAFDRLKARFPSLTGSRQFVTEADWLGGAVLQLTTTGTAPTGAQLRGACLALFSQAATLLESTPPEVQGSRDFHPLPLREAVGDKVRVIEDPHGDGEGIPQSLVSPELRLDLSICDWYPVEEGFGTTEEKAFLVWFSHQAEALEQVYDQVCLLRNERYPALALYDFDTGRRFEPDFLLLLGRPLPGGGYLRRQVYIEPKGEGFRATDAWKEDLLLSLASRARPIPPAGDGTQYEISGLPFFTRGDTAPFQAAFQPLLEG